MKLWMIDEFDGTAPEHAAAFVWADDPEEARSLLRERTGGRDGLLCCELPPERGVAALIGFGCEHDDTVREALRIAQGSAPDKAAYARFAEALAAMGREEAAR